MKSIKLAKQNPVTLQKFTDESQLKVVNARKTKGVIQVRVKLIQKSQSARSLNKTRCTMFTPCCSEILSVGSSTSNSVFNSINWKSVKPSPGDFIEPLDDLTIPSTIDYLSHTKHAPTKSMSDVISNLITASKPPLPAKASTLRTVLKKTKRPNNFLRKKIFNDNFRKTA